MTIPRIVHQIWKHERIPLRWQQAVATVKHYHSDWAYKLWTDGEIDYYVRHNHTELYPVFCAFNKEIMKADVFRYVLMYDFGGLYCDLDYEFLRPYDYGTESLILSLERDVTFGDDENIIANYFFASESGHELWKDVLSDLQVNRPIATTYEDVPELRGPGLLSRVFWKNRDRYTGVTLTEQPIFSPRRIHGPRERKIYLNSGITRGFHHGSGTWKEHWSLPYIKSRLTRLFGM